jgi:hypothetical protein
MLLSSGDQSMPFPNVSSTVTVVLPDSLNVLICWSRHLKAIRPHRSYRQHVPPKCWNILILFIVHWSVQLNNIPIYIQQDATLHRLFNLETALHVSGYTTTHHQERKQLYLQHLVFVTPLLLPDSGR